MAAIGAVGRSELEELLADMLEDAGLDNVVAVLVQELRASLGTRKPKMFVLTCFTLLWPWEGEWEYRKWFVTTRKLQNTLKTAFFFS